MKWSRGNDLLSSHHEFKIWACCQQLASFVQRLVPILILQMQFPVKKKKFMGKERTSGAPTLVYFINPPLRRAFCLLKLRYPTTEMEEQ